jgi:hypothetical protein
MAREAAESAQHAEHVAHATDGHPITASERRQLDEFEARATGTAKRRASTPTSPTSATVEDIPNTPREDVN